MSIKTMWELLRSGGLSECGAAAVLGNFKAESLLISNNVEDRCPLSDAEYTARVDDGRIDRETFAHDAYGYGLYQLTYWTRKQGFYDYAKSKGVSISDETAQVEYCLSELTQDYASLHMYLKTTADLDEASDRVCREFERPAVNNYALRRRYANDIFNSLQGTAAPEETTSTTKANESTPPTIQYGSKGLIVGMAQFCLIRKGYQLGNFGRDSDGCDCDYGNATKSAVESFQRTQNLNVTGAIDSETWRRLWR